MTCHFHAWDIVKAKENIKNDEASGESMMYLRKLAKLQEESPKFFRMNSQHILPKFKVSELKDQTPETPQKKPSPLSQDNSSPGLTQNSPSPKARSTYGSTLASPEGRPRATTTSKLLDRVGKVGSNIASKFSRKKEEKSSEPTIEEDEAGMALALLPVYDISVLRVRPLPTDVNHETMEKHLSNDEFHSLFKMNRKTWEECPKWKKIKIKKEIGLF